MLDSLEAAMADDFERRFRTQAADIFQPGAVPHIWTDLGLAYLRFSEENSNPRSLDIYGRFQKARVADCVARVHAAPTRPLRVVATEAIGGGRGVEVFYSTCADATAEQVIGQYASRWSIEVAHRDVKQCLGFEQPQGWCRKTVERTAPMAMLIDSLVIIWFAREGHRDWQPAGHAWYVTKQDPSFADTLAELKRRSVRRCILSLPLETLGPRKLFRMLENAVGLVA